MRALLPFLGLAFLFGCGKNPQATEGGNQSSGYMSTLSGRSASAAPTSNMNGTGGTPTARPTNRTRPTQKADPKPQPPKPTRKFDPTDTQNTIYWIADRIISLDKAKSNELLYPKDSEAFDAELAGLEGTRVKWTFPFRLAKSVDGGKRVNLQRLESPEGGPGTRDAIIFRVLDATGAAALASGSKTVVGQDAGVIVPTTPELAQLKQGDHITVSGTIVKTIRRKSRSNDENGIFFVLDVSSVEKAK